MFDDAGFRIFENIILKSQTNVFGKEFVMNNILDIAVLVLNIVGIVWLGIKMEHFVLVPVGYIIALIIIGKINETACLIVAIVVAAITLIVLMVKLVPLLIDIIGAINQNAKQVHLLKAIKQNDKEGVKKSIAEGALVNGYYDGIDKFPLQVAIENCDEEMVSFLIEKGADVTYSYYSKNGKPLVTAVKKGDKGIVSILIEKGANVNLDYEGRLPLDCAEGEELIALLKSHGAKTKFEIDVAIKQKIEKQDMLNNDLFVTIKNHDREKAEFIISQGADVNVSDLRFQGLTPLLCAIFEDDIEMVKLLLKHGADARQQVRLIGGGGVTTAIQYTRGLGKQDMADLLEYS